MLLGMFSEAAKFVLMPKKKDVVRRERRAERLSALGSVTRPSERFPKLLKRSLARWEPRLSQLVRVYHPMSASIHEFSL